MIRRYQNVPFTMIANDALRDGRLSFKARGVLAWMLSHTDDWRVNATSAANNSPDGVTAVRSALRELEEFGYLIRRKYQDAAGHWITESIVNENPLDDPVDAPETVTESRFPGVGESPTESRLPEPGSPELGFPGPIPKTITKDHYVRERNTRADGRDPIWDALIDVCAIDATSITKSARGAYNRAVKDLREIGATAEEIRVRGRAFRSIWPDVSMTPTALVRRWAEVGTSAAPVRSGRRSGGVAQHSHDVLARVIAEEAERGSPPLPLDDPDVVDVQWTGS